MNCRLVVKKKRRKGIREKRLTEKKMLKASKIPKALPKVKKRKVKKKTMPKIHLHLMTLCRKMIKMES